MRPLLACATALAIFIAGCSAGTRGEVEVGDDYFDPSEQSLSAGAALLFKVDKDATHAHTVTIHKAGDPLTLRLMNETVRAGDEAGFTFESGGAYHVWCMFHGNMTDGMHMLVKVD